MRSQDVLSSAPGGDGASHTRERTQPAVGKTSSFGYRSAHAAERAPIGHFPFVREYGTARGELDGT
jgi:hypothetical protein